MASSLGDVLAKWTQSVVVPNGVHPKIGHTRHLAQLKLALTRLRFARLIRRAVGAARSESSNTKGGCLMEIAVEVGSPDQKKIIENELRLIDTVSRSLQSPLNISKAVVPADFDKTINELQGTDSYASVRAVQVVAKVLEVDALIVVVFSPIMYTQGWDPQSRILTYLHELLHAVNWRSIPRPEIQSLTDLQYFENLYLFFDEYVADRRSLELIEEIFTSQSAELQAHIESSVNSFIRVINGEQHYRMIKREILKFRLGADMGAFLRNIRDTFSDVSMSIVHLFSYSDHFPKYRLRHAELRDSKFVNQRTHALMAFLRCQYDAERLQLTDGIGLVSEFMENFGMRFEDMDHGSGLYCHVLDI